MKLHPRLLTAEATPLYELIRTSKSVMVVFDAGSDLVGLMVGRKVRYVKAQLVVDAAVAYVGTTGAEGDAQTDRLLNRAPGDVGGPVVGRTVWATPLPGGAEYERRMFVETDHAFDLVIHVVRGLTDAD